MPARALYVERKARWASGGGITIQNPEVLSASIQSIPYISTEWLPWLCLLWRIRHERISRERFTWAWNGSMGTMSCAPTCGMPRPALYGDAFDRQNLAGISIKLFRC